MPETQSTVEITGLVIATLYDENGVVLAHTETKNLVTSIGDQYYAGRAVLSTGLPTQVTGMKLGNGTGTPTKSGAGAALVTYLTGSNKAIDATFPTAVGGVVTWRRTYAPGEATSASPITEVVLVTDSIASNATSTAPNTIARALISGIASKAAGDTLVIQWTHALAGA